MKIASATAEFGRSSGFAGEFQGRFAGAVTFGMFRFIEGKAYLGKTYKYSPRSREVVTLLNKPTGREFTAEIVLVYDDAGYFAMMPTECLDFP